MKKSAGGSGPQSVHQRLAGVAVGDGVGVGPGDGAAAASGRVVKALSVSLAVSRPDPHAAHSARTPAEQAASEANEERPLCFVMACILGVRFALCHPASYGTLRPCRNETATGPPSTATPCLIRLSTAFPGQLHEKKPRPEARAVRRDKETKNRLSVRRLRNGSARKPCSLRPSCARPRAF